MSRKLYFTPGPSALYFTLEEHMRGAMREQIPSISHRGKEFSNIYKHVDDQLRQLVSLPDDYGIFFTSSATETWERLLQSLVKKSTLHLVNGAFSRRFYQIAKKLNYQADIVEVPEGEVVDLDSIPSGLEPELIGVTHNETSTGAQQPVEDFARLRKRFPSSFIAVDAVSSFPVVDLPFDLIDSVYLSVQKCFGLPAGLGVWLVNNRTIERALTLAPTGKTSYHGIDTYLANYKKYQTPSTPNVLAIYLLNKVIGDMLEKGIDKIRMESKYKSAILYHLLESKTSIQPFVKTKDWRSETVIVASSGDLTDKILQELYQRSMVVGSGYGAFRPEHIRVANFPTHSKEQIEMLVDALDSIVD